MTQDFGRALREPALVNHAPTGHGPSGFDPARDERQTIQQLFVRVCRDSGFQLDVHRACWLTAKVVGRSPLEVWMALPSLAVMEQIANGTHPATHRDTDRSGEAGQTAKQAGPKARAGAAEGGIAQTPPVQS